MEAKTGITIYESLTDMINLFKGCLDGFTSERLARGIKTLELLKSEIPVELAERILE